MLGNGCSSACVHVMLKRLNYVLLDFIAYIVSVFVFYYIVLKGGGYGVPLLVGFAVHEVLTMAIESLIEYLDHKPK